MVYSGRRAFTLVEMLVVVAIIGLLAGIAAATFPQYLRKAKLIKTKVKIDALNNAIERFRVHNNRYPQPGRMMLELTSRTGVRWDGPYIEADSEDNRTLRPANNEPIAKFHQRAVIRAIDTTGDPITTASYPNTPTPGLDGFMVGEPGFADAFGRRVIYYPSSLYGDPNHLCVGSVWDDFACVPYFAPRLPPSQTPPIETPFYGETNFVAPYPITAAANYGSFVLISAGWDGKLVVTSDRVIVPMIFDNGLNDDGGQGVVASMNDDRATDEFFTYRGRILEDDVVNY